MGTGETEGDEVGSAHVAEEKDGEDEERRNGFTRNAKRTETGGDDGEESDGINGSRHQVETHGEAGEGEERRNDEGCQAALSISTIERQTEGEEEEDDEVNHGGGGLEQISSDDQNCLQQPCL